MKFYTTDSTVLMDVSRIAPHEKGILMEGKILGTMPMKAILQPEELRAAMRFISPRLIWVILRMLITGKV
jgi:hypothetical protein